MCYVLCSHSSRGTLHTDSLFQQIKAVDICKKDLTIFNEGVYMTVKLIFHKALNLF